MASKREDERHRWMDMGAADMTAGGNYHHDDQAEGKRNPQMR
jgi:hypothetical protein